MLAPGQQVRAAQCCSVVGLRIRLQQPQTAHMMNTHSVNNTMHDEHTLSTHSKNSKIKLFSARLFPRLQIGCFSCSLAELFLAPHTHLLCPWNLGQYQRWSVLSTSRLSSHFPLGWIATCVVLFTHTGGLQESGARF